MNRLQRLLYNEGERLVPYVSHDESELVRHRSSYAFFHAVVAADLESQPPSPRGAVSIVDLGFGTGYGCALLSSLPNTVITGVDIAPECEVFARQYYSRRNVSYVIEDLRTYIPRMQPFDYAVSRGVLEHVPNGIQLVRQIRFTCRAMIDVPYDEQPGNEHHVLTGIREEAFAGLPDCELFYEDLDGQIFDAAHKPDRANMIMAVLSAPGMPPVGSVLRFPVPPVRGDRIELASRSTIAGSHHQYDVPEELLLAVQKAVRETEVVLDVGCGIAPMNYFRPKLHILVEPWHEYAEILAYRYAGDKSVVILRTGAVEALEALTEGSVDSIFLLDVLEHMEKNEGLQVVRAAERVAREQVVVFTPLGFMPQRVEAGEVDGWGLSGVGVQEHRSGWTPEDFTSAWSFHICQRFHRVNHRGEPLNPPYGAFFAILNQERRTVTVPASMSDFRRPLPSEMKAARLAEDYQRLEGEHQRLAGECQRLEGEHLRLESRCRDLDALCTQRERDHAALQEAYEALLRSRSVRVARLARKLMGPLGRLGR